MTPDPSDGLNELLAEMYLIHRRHEEMLFDLKAKIESLIAALEDDVFFSNDDFAQKYQEALKAGLIEHSLRLRVFDERIAHRQRS